MASRNIFDAKTAVLSNPENSDVLNSVTLSRFPESEESDEMLSDSEKPTHVHEAEDGTQWSKYPTKQLTHSC